MGPKQHGNEQATTTTTSRARITASARPHQLDFGSLSSPTQSPTSTPGSSPACSFKWYRLGYVQHGDETATIATSRALIRASPPLSPGDFSLSSQPSTPGSSPVSSFKRYRSACVKSPTLPFALRKSFSTKELALGASKDATVSRWKHMLSCVVAMLTGWGGSICWMRYHCYGAMQTGHVFEAIASATQGDTSEMAFNIAVILSYCAGFVLYRCVAAALRVYTSASAIGAREPL